METSQLRPLRFGDLHPNTVKWIPNVKILPRVICHTFA
jgi:hypothetical protein